MKRRVAFLGAVVTAAAMLGAFPAIVGAHHEVPFKGSADLTQTSAQQLPHNNTLLTFAGTGQATPLGPVLRRRRGGCPWRWQFLGHRGAYGRPWEPGFQSAHGASISEGFFTVNGGTGPYTNATGEGIVKHTSSDNFVHVHQTFDGTIRF